MSVSIIGVLRRIVGVAVGVGVGAATNMGLVLLFGQLIPPPEGVDPGSLESIRAHIADYGPVHFVGPFLAHALGTLVGAMVATLVGGSKGPAAGLVVGAVFMAGGIAMVAMIPETPIWFAASDIVLAYLPMGWLGWRAVRGR